MSTEPATIRKATADDVGHITEAAFLAGHGMFEIMYEGLLPGRSARQAYAERRILKPGHFSHWSRWLMAEDGSGAVMGALNIFPQELLLTTEPDPLITEERLGTLAGVDLEERAVGAYYLNIVAVLPEFRGLGLGAALVRHAVSRAVEEGFDRIALATWGDDEHLMTFYRHLGFRTAFEIRIAPDPRLNAGTLFVVLQRSLAPVR
jgi:ribosomal protein S18 acetylase RimI-like enzyme